MRSLFWLLLIAALAIGIALLGRLTDGYVLWVVPPWRVEVSFNLFVLGQVTLLVVAYLLLRAISHTLNLPRVVGEFRARRARRRDERTAAEALRLFWEGRYSQALKSAENVGADSTVVAARGVAAQAGLRAAHALRDAPRIAEWQARAEAMDCEGWRTARLMGEIRIALDARDFDAAAAALAQLGPKERRQISVQRLALRLAQGQGDWDELLHLAHQLEKHRALTPEQAQPLRLHAYHGMLETVQDDPAKLMRHWKKTVPAEHRRDPRLALRVSHALAVAGACAESAQLVEDYLDEIWDSSLLTDYAVCEDGDLLGRIAHCEKWLNAHPQDAMLLLTLGRLCIRRQLWGKAQSYLEASLAVAPSAAAHIEIARLFDHLERLDEANRHYRVAANFQNQDMSPSQSRGGRNSV